MEREDELITKAIVRLNVRLMGTLFGLLSGLGLFVATNILVFKGGPNVGSHLGLLAQFFPGYTVTFAGSFVGFLYAFVVGFLLGSVIGGVYNKIARV